MRISARTDDSQDVALEIRVQETRPAEKGARPGWFQVLNDRHEVGEQISDLTDNRTFSNWDGGCSYWYGSLHLQF